MQKPQSTTAAESIRPGALPFKSAAEIAQTAPAEVNWLVPPWVVAGGLTLIDGKPKVAGKSTFVLHMAQAVTTGTKFMAEPTTKTAVVMLTEERPTSFRRNLERIGLLDTENLHVLFHHDLKRTPWPDVMAQATRKCREVGAGLLIVDTLAQFSGISETSSGKVMEALQPIQAAAASGLAVICVRHERKRGGDVGDSGRGSSALTGAADIVMAIKRPRDYAGPIRLIEALSRFEETPAGIAVELGDDGYVLVEGVDVGAHEVDQKVLEQAPLDEASAKTAEQFTKDTALKKTVLRGALTRLVRAGTLLKKGTGRRNAPYRYWRASTQVAPPSGEGKSSGTH